MPRKARTTEGRAVDVLLVRIGELPHRAQLELHARLGEHLSDVANVALTKTDEKVERQQAALEAMKAVAAVQGRPEKQAPVSTDFNARAEALGLNWTVKTVSTAFGSWRNATRTYEEGRAPDSARHLRHREFTGGAPATYPDYLDYIEEWVEQKRADDEETPASYERWRRPEVERRQAAGEPTPTSWHQMRRSFPELDMSDVIALARDRTRSPVDLCRERAEARLATEPNPLQLVTSVTAAALLGLRVNQIENARARGRVGFPEYVAVIAKEPVWVVDDIRAYGRHGPNAAQPRTRGELQHLIVDQTQLAELLGRARPTLYEHIQEESWHLVPKPDGYVAFRKYWLRKNVESFTPTPKLRARRRP